MRIFRHTSDLPADARGAVVALGNFDGVHRGHGIVIGQAAETARRLGVPTAVVTFEPHPRRLFRPDDPPFRLTPFRTKAHHLEHLGVDLLFVIHFDWAFASRTAEQFVDEVLVQGLAARHVVAGYDFVFGRGRGGDLAMLERMAGERGFGVTRVMPVRDGTGTVFSSTRIRELLVEGRPREAAEVLGRAWEIEGRVEQGFQRGRTIGFPTANVALGDYLRPAFGVYAVRAGVDRANATQWLPGVANLGRRPTVGGTAELLEVHLFDGRYDLYGQHLRVQLVDFLRHERKFDGLDALRGQIARDAEAARHSLST